MTPDKITEQLRQDASAYSQGFADGYRLAKKALITCKECIHHHGHDCENMNYRLTSDDFYCGWMRGKKSEVRLFK